MDLCIDRDTDIYIYMFDKRDAFPFVVIRYPHMCSVIPTNIPYGVFTGLLYRRYRICSRAEVFIRRAADAAVTLIKQGCAKSRLVSLFRRFLVKRSPIRWTVSLGSLCKQFAACL